MKWREAVQRAIVRRVKRSGHATVSRRDLLEHELRRIVAETGSSGLTPDQTLSRVLQELAAEGVVKRIRPGVYAFARKRSAPKPSAVRAASKGTAASRSASKTSGGSGYGAPERNALVERAAVEAATRLFQQHGWSVESRETRGEGFDLLCSNGKRSLHVEVKGISGRGRDFVLTAKERRRCSNDRSFVFAIVTNALRGPHVHLLRGIDAERLYRFDPLQFMARSTSRKLPNGASILQ